MAYVIICVETRRYVLCPQSWTERVEDASRFASQAKAQNFLQYNFPHEYRDTPVSSVEIRDAAQANLSDYNEESAEQTLSDLVATADNLIASYERFSHLPAYYRQQISRYDKETQDLLHLIEQKNEDVVGGFRLYKQLQKVRQNRRGAKDNLSLTELLIRRIYPDGLSIKAEKERWEREREERRYHPRVLTDLFEGMSHHESAS